MKKKGRRGGPPKKKLESAVETFSNDEDDRLDLDLPSTEDENLALMLKKKKRSSLPTVELSDSDEEYDDEDESGDEDYINARSWGKEKRNFYGGNLVAKDPGEDDFEEDEDFDKTEARESQMMQLKQLEKLDEEDFADMFILPKSSAPSSVALTDDSKIRGDMGNMTEKEKTELFYQEAPEFRSIVADFKVKLKEAKDFLYPAIKLMEKGSIPGNGLAARLIKTKFDLIVNYCVNIYSYLIFKSRRVQLKSHISLSGRLVQYKKLLDDLIPLEKEVMKEVKSVMHELNDGGKSISDLVQARRQEKESEAPSTAKPVKPRKKLRILENNVVSAQRKELPESIEEKIVGFPSKAEQEEEDSFAEEDEENSDEEGNEERRAINYQIAKNKGLTPKRNKLQRNPRVKHRVKFQKAKVRRKGQVRTVRTEVKKYSGEISGINARVKKGIKLA